MNSSAPQTEIRKANLWVALGLVVFALLLLAATFFFLYLKHSSQT